MRCENCSLFRLLALLAVQEPTAQAIDLVLGNAKVRAVDQLQRWAEAVAIDESGVTRKEYLVAPSALHLRLGLGLWKQH